VAFVAGALALWAPDYMIKSLTVHYDHTVDKTRSVVSQLQSLM